MFAAAGFRNKPAHLPGRVADEKAFLALYDDPRRREAASGRHGTKIASLPLFTRLQTYRCIALSDVMGQ
jgi:hypothetical protein